MALIQSQPPQILNTSRCLCYDNTTGGHKHIFFFFSGVLSKWEPSQPLNKQLWERCHCWGYYSVPFELWNLPRVRTVLHRCVTDRWIAEIGPFCEMVEREADQAFLSLLDVSLSLKQGWVTEDPITLQDSPPSVTDRRVLTVSPRWEEGGKCSSSHINITSQTNIFLFYKTRFYLFIFFAA